MYKRRVWDQSSVREKTSGSSNRKTSCEGHLRTQSAKIKGVDIYHFLDELDQNKKPRRQIHMDDYDPFQGPKLP